MFSKLWTDLRVQARPPCLCCAMISEPWIQRSMLSEPVTAVSDISGSHASHHWTTAVTWPWDSEVEGAVAEEVLEAALQQIVLHSRCLSDDSTHSLEATKSGQVALVSLEP